MANSVGNPLSIAVLDVHGNEIDGSMGRLDVALQEAANNVSRKKNDARFFMLIVGAEGVCVHDHVVGSRLSGRQDLGRIIAGRVVRKDSGCSLLVFTNEGHKKLLALPSLETILEEPLRTYETRPGFVDIASNGDFLDLKDGEIQFRTCFASAERGQQPTETKLYDPSRKVPQPALLASGVAYMQGLLAGNRANTAAALDALLAGENRPVGQPSVSASASPLRPERKQPVVQQAGRGHSSQASAGSSASVSAFTAGLPALPKGLMRSDSQASDRRHDQFLDSRRDVTTTKTLLQERDESRLIVDQN